MNSRHQPELSADLDRHDEDGLDIPESHKRELDRRLALHQQNPSDVLSLEEIRARLLDRARPE